MRPFLPHAFVIALAVVTPSPSDASPPNIISHQGRITVDGQNYTGTGHFKFALVSVQFNSAQWSHDGTDSGVGDEPESSLPVTVTGGHYTVPLGDTSFHANMTDPIPVSALTIFAAQNGLGLRTWFSQSGNPGTFERLSPDRRLTSAPYSIVSLATEGVAGDLDMENNELQNAFKVGIGVAEPRSRLHIRNEDLTLPTNYSSQILIEAQGASLGLFTKAPIGAQNFAQPKIRLGEGLAGEGTFLQFRKIASNAGSIPNALVIDWGSATGSSSSASPKFVFTQNSRLGVGTLDPDSSVHISSGTTPTLKIQSNGTNEESGRVSLRQSDESGADLYYDGSSTEGLRIDAVVTGTPQATSLFVSNKSATRGNVGIGTTDPLSPLHVNGTARISRLHAGAGTPADANYNYIANSDPNPISGDISNSIDLFMSGDLEARRIYGTFLPPSDRNLKEAFAPVDVREILEKVSALPITTWQYKRRPDCDEDEKARTPSRHIGPVAQDFHASFAVGPNNRTIATIDADGVALAAIQALKDLNDEKDRQIAELRARLDAVEARLDQN